MGGTKRYSEVVGRIYGYIRISRRQAEGQSGSDPESQVLQLRDAGVPPGLIDRDVGISGAIGTNNRKAWQALNARLGPGDVLVVTAVDRIGRRWMRWMDTVGTLRNLRSRQVRIRSLAPSEQQWTRYFDADPDLPEAVIGTCCQLLHLDSPAGVGEHTQEDQGGPGQSPEQWQDPGNAAEDDGLEGGDGQVLPEGRADQQADWDGSGCVQNHGG